MVRPGVTAVLLYPRLPTRPSASPPAYRCDQAPGLYFLCEAAFSSRKPCRLASLLAPSSRRIRLNARAYPGKNNSELRTVSCFVIYLSNQLETRQRLWLGACYDRGAPFWRNFVLQELHTCSRLNTAFGGKREYYAMENLHDPSLPRKRSRHNNETPTSLS